MNNYFKCFACEGRGKEIKNGTITFKGKKYPTRELTVRYTDDKSKTDHTLLIATESLENAMDWENKEADAELDQTIYFYVEDEQINKPDAELFKFIDAEGWELVVE